MNNRRPFSAFVDDPHGWREYYSLAQAVASHREYQAWLGGQCPESGPGEDEPPILLEAVSAEQRDLWASAEEYSRYLLENSLVA